jgi:hypothetical protein
MLGLFGSTNFARLQRDRLVEACGSHIDFLDACVTRLSSSQY